MSNPYDPYQNSGQTPGQDPGQGSGDQPPPPYGQSPEYPSQSGYGGDSSYGSSGGSDGGYGGGYGGGGYAGGGYGAPPPPPYGNEPSRGNDAVSITGFVLSLTCCLSIVGVILGFIGLRRTKPGTRKGRWAAISAIAVGIPLTLAAVGIGVFIAIYAGNAITIDDAEVGQCMNVDDGDDDTIYLQKKDCSEDHDAEIVFVGKLSNVPASELTDDLSSAQVAESICTAQMDAGDVSTIGDAYEYGIASDDIEDPGPNDEFLCYIEPVDGDKTDTKVLD